MKPVGAQLEGFFSSALMTRWIIREKERTVVAADQMGEDSLNSGELMEIIGIVSAKL